MAVSIDQLPDDMVSVVDGRWLFQLDERINGHHGGALLEEGRTVEPVTNAVLKRFICGHGHAMIGAFRVVGPPAEIGNCAALGASRTPPAAPAPEREHAPEPEPEPEREHAPEQTVVTRRGRR